MQLHSQILPGKRGPEASLNYRVTEDCGVSAPSRFNESKITGPGKDADSAMLEGKKKYEILQSFIKKFYKS